jgi:hypothetical protein
MRTFRNPYTEQAYRRSVTGLDEEIAALQSDLTLIRRNWQQLGKRRTLNRLLELHRKRNALMK